MEEALRMGGRAGRRNPLWRTRSGRLLRGAGAGARASSHADAARREIFAPILYLIEFEIWTRRSLAQRCAARTVVGDLHNDLIAAETFLSARGSDCGIANVNIGTSGAEIGGAFGGEKDTGGGRESGSDAWKAYMRRQTVTINWSNELPLAQGIDFSL